MTKVQPLAELLPPSRLDSAAALVDQGPVKMSVKNNNTNGDDGMIILEKWGDRVKAMLQYKTPDEFYVHGAVYRATNNYFVLPIACLGCISWSTVWRLFCCPVQVFKNGFYYSCSNNGCTDCSDMCLTSAYKTANERQTLPLLRTILAAKKVRTGKSDMDEQERVYIREVFDLVEKRFFASDGQSTTTYSRVDYVAAEIVMASISGNACCMPAYVGEELLRARRSFNV
jgi:hypothetical protein